MRINTFQLSSTTKITTVLIIQLKCTTHHLMVRVSSQHDLLFTLQMFNCMQYKLGGIVPKYSVKLLKTREYEINYTVYLYMVNVVNAHCSAMIILCKVRQVKMRPHSHDNA